MSILENINSSADIKKLDREQLPQLCDELRKFEIENIAKTGGHLSPNLGTVELTVAIHRVYDTEKDRLVFDVGHQSYTHKIITGRREQFGTLRQYGGLSGFPKPSESNDDAFIAGHASNSVSVALGMARARTLTGGDYDIVSVIGDGALTGGLSHEGLADAAASGEPVVIILNDNNMSISENVGGMAQVLQNMRIKPAYISFKQWLKGVSENIPGLYKAFHVIKEWLKSRLLPGNVFSEMGLYYLGPVDGHDLDKLETAIRLARDVRKTVVLHVLTKKGKGCAYAESHPDKYHGIGRFDPETGELAPTAVSFSDKAGEYLCQYAENDPRIVAITAAMAGGTGTECFASKFPERFFDVGIAEGHGVTMAAGMAKQGLVPVFAVYSSFLQRGFDMLIHDVSLLGLHTVFCVDRAGLVGNDGETHQGVFDVCYLSAVPGMTILCPASFQELHDMLGYAIHEVTGPAAVRYPRGGEGNYKEDSGRQNLVVLREGADITLCAYGTMINNVLDAAEILHEQGIEARVVKINAISPLYDRDMREVIGKTKAMLVAEECAGVGCMGQRMAAILGWNKISPERLELCNLGKAFPAQGTVEELYREFGLDAESLAKKAAEVLR